MINPDEIANVVHATVVRGLHARGVILGGEQVRDIVAAMLKAGWTYKVRVEVAIETNKVETKWIPSGEIVWHEDGKPRAESSFDKALETAAKAVAKEWEKARKKNEGA